jgi:multidrug efflux system outer membrane protein
VLRLSSYAVLAVTLCGCTTLTQYVAPSVTETARYAAQGTATKSITAEASWWHTFNDKTLNRLIDAGLSDSLTVAQAVERIVAVRESAAASGLGGLPTGATTVQETASGRSGTSEISVTATVNGSLNWELDLFDGLAKKREAARATLDAAIEEANGARLSLIGEVARNYVQARGYQDRLHIARSTLAAQNRTLEVTRQQNAAGVTSALDLAQLQGDVSTTAATIPSLEIALSASIHRLSVLLGQEPSALNDLFKSGAQIPRVSTSVSAGIPADLMRDRPDIRQAERQLASATADIGVAEADLLPSLSLTGNLSLSTISTWTLGPSLSLPLFNQGQLRATVRLEESQARQSYLSYRQTVLEAVEEVENALVGFSKQQTRRKHLANSYASYTKATELAEERFEAGETTLVTLLTAQRSLYSARDALAQSSVDVALQYISLSLALGGGWDASK